jgi:hypothetical protein
MGSEWAKTHRWSGKTAPCMDKKIMPLAQKLKNMLVYHTPNDHFYNCVKFDEISCKINIAIAYRHVH